MEAIFTTAKKNGKSLIIFEDIEVLCQRDAKMQDLRSMFCYHAYNTCSVGTDGGTCTVFVPFLSRIVRNSPFSILALVCLIVMMSSNIHIH